MAVDLAGFEAVAANAGNKKKHLDNTAIVICKVNDNKWWVDKIDYGRWDIKEICERIIKHARNYDIKVLGIERGSLKRALMPYLSEMMLKTGVFPRVEEINQGNRSKVDKVVGSLQGRFEHGAITLKEDEWNKAFIDELLNFPTTGVHDDMVDALSLIAHVAVNTFDLEIDEDDYEPLDVISAY
jgi:predicted phage terminase large subunit-like protein